MERLEVSSRVRSLLGKDGVEELVRVWNGVGASTRTSIKELLKHLEENHNEPFWDSNVHYEPRQTVINYVNGRKKKERWAGKIVIKSQKITISLPR